MPSINFASNPRPDGYVEVDGPSQVAIAIMVIGNPNAQWSEREMEELLKGLGHSMALDDVYIPYQYQAHGQTSFLTVNRVNNSWEWMPTATIDPEIDVQHGPWLYITRPYRMAAFQYAGTLAKDVNAKSVSCKGGTLKLVVMGMAARVGASGA